MNKIYDRRKELGLTLEQVGDICGVGKSTVRKWEIGLIDNMGRDKIVLLAKALQVSPLYILNCESDKPLSKQEHLLLSYYNQLNSVGRDKLLESAQDLVLIDKYTEDFLQPIAAHAIKNSVVEDQDYDEQLIHDDINNN